MTDRNATRTSYLALAVAALIAAALIGLAMAAGGQVQTYQGAIDATGYHLTAPAWATWCRTSCRSFLINDGVDWDGQDLDSKLARYAGSDATVNGWTALPAVNLEHKGGEISAAMIELYRRAGLNREPTSRELWDFAFANPCGGYLCGCGYYEGITGSPHPITPGCGVVAPTPRPTPVPTPAPTATPPPPDPAPSPSPSPVPAATPCPPQWPCDVCVSPAVRKALEAVPPKGIRRVTWKLRAMVDRALAELDAHDECSTP